MGDSLARVTPRRRSSRSRRSSGRLIRGKSPVAFSHVTEAAQPFLVAALAGEIRRTLWIICPTVRSQELLYETLLNWQSRRALPAGSRIRRGRKYHSRIRRSRRSGSPFSAAFHANTGPHVVVATRASLDQSAPKTAALELGSPSSETRRPRNHGAFDRIARRSRLRTRRAGHNARTIRRPRRHLSTSSPGRRSSRCAWNFSVTKSNRCVSSTSIPKPPCGISKRSMSCSARPKIKAESCATTSRRSPSGRDRAGGAIGGSKHPDQRRLDRKKAKRKTSTRRFLDAEIGEFAVGDFMLVEAKRSQFAARLAEWRAGGARIVIYFQTEGEIERFREIMAGRKAHSMASSWSKERSRAASLFQPASWSFCPAAELFGRSTTHGRRRLAARGEARAQSRADRLQRTERRRSRRSPRAWRRSFSRADESARGRAAECRKCSRSNLPTTRSSTSRSSRRISSRATSASAKNRRRSVRSPMRNGRARKRTPPPPIFDYAGKMLAVQAERETQLGHAFGPDTKWQSEFEHSFPYRETADQLKAIDATKQRHGTARARWIG